MSAELTADERAWLDACPLGHTRSVTINGRKYEVVRPACGVTFGGEAIKRDTPMVSIPQPPVDASREPAPWETTGVPIHGLTVDSVDSRGFMRASSEVELISVRTVPR